MKVEFIESEFWGVALLVAEADFKLAKTKDAEFDSLAHATAAFANLFDVDYNLTWIIPLHGANIMQLWMRLRKTEQLFFQLAPRSIQSVDGLKFKCRTTINRNVCFTPMRMGTT